MSVVGQPSIVRISAKGQSLQLGLGVRVVKLSYQDSEEKDDLCTIGFHDPFFKLTDSEQFSEGTEWIVQWGFPGKMHPPRKVLLKRPKFRYGEVEVECLDKGSQLKVQENWDVPTKVTPRQIIQKIAEKNQLEAIISGEGLDEVMSCFPFAGRTDFDVLKYFEARAQNHVFKVQNDKLMFTRRELEAPPKATFEYAPGRASRLISYEISVKDQDNAKKSKRTTAVSVDPYTRKKKVYHADESSTSTTNLGTRRVIDNIKTSFKVDSLGKVLKGGTKTATVQGQATGSSLIVPPGSDKEIENLAKGHRHKSLLDNCEARFEIVASPDDPFLNSGDLIEVRGIGKKFSGIYRIINITHDVSDGYKYQIDAKRNAVGKTGKSAKGPKLNGVENTKKAVAAGAEKIKKFVTGAISKLPFKLPAK